MKILFAATSEKVSNGAAKCLIEMVQQLEKRGHRVVVVVPNYGTMENELKELGIECVVFRERHCWTISEEISLYVIAKRVVNYFTIYKIAEYIKNEKFDIVHINAITAYTVAAAAYKAKVPVVWHIREFLEDDLNIHFAWEEWSKRMICRANKIIAISNPVKEKWERQLKTSILVINDGLPIQNYKIDNKKLKNEIGVILYGRIAEGKGQLFYVNAIKNVLKKIEVPVKFYYAGLIQDTEYYKKIVNFISENGLESEIEYLGEIEDVKQLLKTINIVCVCSKREGFGRVTVEALLAKCLVIGANTGATCEILGNNEYGMLYEEGNLDDFSEKLINGIQNYKEYLDMIERAQKNAEKKYSLEYDIDQIEDVYREICYEN